MPKNMTISGIKRLKRCPQSRAVISDNPKSTKPPKPMLNAQRAAGDQAAMPVFSC